jgi:hypothetical protein
MASDTASILSPPPEVTDFQTRRRRAAKLTQFFGVNYRELVTNVLDDIEHGVQNETKRGTLQPDEAEVRIPILPVTLLVVVSQRSSLILMTGPPRKITNIEDETRRNILTKNTRTHITYICHGAPPHLFHSRQDLHA